MTERTNERPTDRPTDVFIFLIFRLFHLALQLVLVMRSGAIAVKMLRRTANVEAKEGGVVSGPPPEQDVPLALPQKTQLYVDQTDREREQAVEMHRAFQVIDQLIKR